MATTDTPTRLAGRYTLGPVIGHGGMGDVLRAYDERLGRDVAVKFLREDLARQPDLRARFESEARAAAALSHPNIVAIFDTAETDDGVPYIVMECLPGTTLAHEIDRGPLDPARARQVALRVLDALSVAHDAGIVHRDIKPGNILLTNHGDVKVADFGIAKSVDDDQNTGVLLGTAAYIAPERLAGERATPASDLYAVGVVLYEALSGRKPFTGDSPIAVVRAVQRANPEPLVVRDKQLRMVIERAMERDTARRYPSARDMAKALDGSSAATTAPVGAPHSATPTATITQPPPRRRPRSAPRRSPAALRGSWSRRRALVAAVIGAVLLGLLAFVAISTTASDDPAPSSGSSTSASTTPVAPGAAPLPPRLESSLEQLRESITR